LTHKFLGQEKIDAPMVSVGFDRHGRNLLNCVGGNFMEGNGAMLR